MQTLKRKFSSAFGTFLGSEKSSGILLIICTLASLLIANSSFGTQYVSFWHTRVAGMSVEEWINDALMSVFFLLVGLELERELYVGELADFRKAALVIVAAVGGMLVPALIHYSLNAGTPAQSGFGVPMATDIAFVLTALAFLGKRVPASLRIFVAAYAVIDDLGAVMVIAAFYTAQLSYGYLAAALAVLAVLCLLNRLRVMSLVPYVLGGMLMWYLTLRSGVHATVAGVVLAFAIPFSARNRGEHSPSHRLEGWLYNPVALVILPAFALANTGVVLTGGWWHHLTSANSMGIAAGLILGKPAGIVLFCYVAITTGLCRLPPTVNWNHLMGAGILGGIGFTMSIFIANLAFNPNHAVIDASKITILLASSISGVLGILYLRLQPAVR